MLKLKEVVSLKKPNIPFPEAVEELEVRIDIELSAEDEAYSEKGNYLVVIYDKVKKEMNGYYFFGVKTGDSAEDEYIALCFTDNEEEMVLDYLNDYFKECSMVL